MNAATPWAAVEVVKVVPDRRRTKDPFCHSRNQIRDDKGFPLHVADGCIGIAEGKVDGEFESTSPGTKSQPMNLTQPSFLS